METHNSITSLLPAPKSSQKFQMRKMTSIHDKNLVPAHLIKRKDSKKKKPQPTRSPLMPQNPTPSTPQSISGPKRALKNDLSNVNIKIENIISEWNNKNDAADADSSVEHTSKYHMDSIFDDFTLMADNGKKTLTTLASDLQLSEANATELIEMLNESETSSKNAEVMDNCTQAKQYIVDTLAKISSCMKHDKSLTKEELKNLAEELEKQNGVFHDLEGEMKVKGETLERQHKEFDLYRTQATSKMNTMRDKFEENRQELTNEMRQLEQNTDLLELQLANEQRNNATLSAELFAKSNTNGTKVASPLKSPKLLRKSSSDSNSSSGFASASANNDMISSYQIAAREAKELMREKDKQINSLQMDMQTMSDMESMRIKTQSSSKKIMVNVDIQTEKKQWGKRNPTQTSLDYFGQFLKEYDCDDLIVREHMSEWRSLESSMETLTKKANDFERENRVFAKRAEKNEQLFNEATEKSTQSANQLKELKIGSESKQKKTENFALEIDHLTKINEQLVGDKERLGIKLAESESSLADTETNLKSQFLKSEGLQNLVQSKDKMVGNLEEMMKSQKEMFEEMAAKNSGDSNSQMAAQMKLVNELNIREESVNKLELSVEEREVLLGVKEKELGMREDELSKSQGNLEANSQNLTSTILENTKQRELELEDKYNSMLEAEKAKHLEHSTKGLALDEEMQQLRTKFKEIHDLEQANELLLKKKEEHMAAEQKVDEQLTTQSVKRKTLVEMTKKMDVEERRLSVMENIFREKEAALKTGLEKLDEEAGEITNQEFVKLLKKEFELSEMAMQENIDLLNLSLTEKDIEFKQLEVKFEELEEVSNNRNEELNKLKKSAENEEKMKMMSLTSDENGKQKIIEQLQKQFNDMEQELEKSEKNMKIMSENVSKREEEMETKMMKVEKYLNAEMEKMAAKENKNISAIDNINIDWYDNDLSASANNEGFLKLVESWVGSIRAKKTAAAGESITNAVVIKDAGRVELFLTEKLLPPLQHLFGAIDDQLTPALRRNLGNVIIQAEKKFSHPYSGQNVKDMLDSRCNNLRSTVKRHNGMIDTLTKELTSIDKRISSSSKKSWPAVRKLMTNWIEASGTLGKLLGRQQILDKSANELDKLEGSFVQVVVNGAEDDNVDRSEELYEALNLGSMRSSCDELIKSVSRTDDRLNLLLEKNSNINTAAESLAIDYEESELKKGARGRAASFDRKFDLEVDMGSNSNNNNNNNNDNGDTISIEKYEDLQLQLLQLTAEVSALNSNKYEELMQGDESYGALMFFSFLQERNFEEKLSSTVGEISDLRKALQGGANGGHISFNDMKKRVENLVKVRVPVLNKIKNRYGKLHKKWSGERWRRLKELGLGDEKSEGASCVCPICNVDRRNLKEGKNELKGGEGDTQITKKIEKPVFKKEVMRSMSVMKLAKTWKRNALVKKPNEVVVKKNEAVVLAAETDNIMEVEIGVGGGVGVVSGKRGENDVSIESIRGTVAEANASASDLLKKSAAGWSRAKKSREKTPPAATFAKVAREAEIENLGWDQPGEFDDAGFLPPIV